MKNQSLNIITFLLLLITSISYSSTGKIFDFSPIDINQRYSNTSLCQNNGFIVQSRSLNDICFCYGTGFYGDYCEIACPEVMPTECIVI